MVTVTLYVYDISQGMARQLSMSILGKQIDGVWHTSVVCYGKEYFFGSGGIDHCPPCGTILGAPNDQISLGETLLSEDVFQQYLRSLSVETFRPDKYQLLEHNCNTFSNEVAQFLTGKKIPSHIVDLPRDVMSTPFGSMIAQFLKDVQIQPRVNNSTYGNDQSLYGTDQSLYGIDQPQEPVQKHPDGASLNSSTNNGSKKIKNLSLRPKTYPTIKYLEDSFKILKEFFVDSISTLVTLQKMINVEKTDERNSVKEDEINRNICSMLEALNFENCDMTVMKSLLIVLKSSALVIPQMYVSLSGNEVILAISNIKLVDFKLIQLEFLANLLSNLDVRDNILSNQHLCTSITNMVVSAILDDSDVSIQNVGCCLAYTASLVQMNADHVFEISSALLHIVANLPKENKSREFCIGALQVFVSSHDEVKEIAEMLAVDIYEQELKN